MGGWGGDGLGGSSEGERVGSGRQQSVCSQHFSVRSMAGRARSPDARHILRDHDRKKCHRCKYIRLREKWNIRCMEGDEAMIAEQPDLEKPWGLGCVICSRYKAWLKTDEAAEGAVSPRDAAGALA